MKDKGTNPKKKNIIPLVIILYVKPANMFNNMWPDKRPQIHPFVNKSPKT